MLRLLATEGKSGDPRWPAFARRYGFDPRRPVQWEVEALEPDELQRLVLAAVDRTSTATSSSSRSSAKNSSVGPWRTSPTSGARRVRGGRRRLDVTVDDVLGFGEGPGLGRWVIDYPNFTG
ncbi:hypothetical protein ACFWVF_21475 [Streptomyces sp. NPDC058659]|uniref:hypothetical protein n=1 Tax=unclassified Streptomyces TaxID=2593676 RepID=UPI0036626AFC